MQVTGLVVAINKRRMLIATPDFRFHRIPLPKAPPSLGSEVTVTLPSPWPARIRLAVLGALGSVGAAALLLLGSPLAFAQPAEWVALDLHPAFLLQVSQKGNVLQVIPKDASAKQVMAGLSLVGQPLATDIQRLLQQSRRAGYLTMRHPAVVAVAVHPLVATPPVSLPQVRALVQQQIRVLAPKRATLPVLQSTAADNRVWSAIATGDYLDALRRKREKLLQKVERQRQAVLQKEEQVQQKLLQEKQNLQQKLQQDRQRLQQRLLQKQQLRSQRSDAPPPVLPTSPSTQIPVSPASSDTPSVSNSSDRSGTYQSRSSRYSWWLRWVQQHRHHSGDHSQSNSGDHGSTGDS